MFVLLKISGVPYKKNNHHEKNKNKQQTTILIVILMLGGIMLSNLRSIGQTPPGNYTKKYANVYTGGLVYTDNVVIEAFNATSAINNNGFVIFQTEYDASNMSNLIIHLIDDNGTILFTRRYDLNVNGFNVALDNMVPIAAAYNAASQQYIVVGNGRNLNANSRINPWYLILDQDLNFVNIGAIDLISNSAMGANDNNTLVTDVCAIEGVNTLRFALVGMILDNGIDLTPGGTSPLDRRMFISTLSSAYAATSMEYDFAIGATALDPYYFPARITEVPTATNGGLFVTGTGAIATAFNDSKGFFYFRTDYGMAPSGLLSLDNPSNAVDFFAGGNLRYDAGTDDILVSGTINGNSANGPAFFFDKILDVSSTSAINTFSTSTTWWNGSLGTKRLSTTFSGYAKSGSITSTHTNSGTYILGKLYDNSTALTLPVAMGARYGDNDLMNWTTNQTNNLEYYPRSVNNISPVQYYSGCDWNQIWYPSHGSAQYPLAAYGTYQFGLAGLDDNPATTIAMNFTDNVYANGCQHFNTTVALNLIPVSSIGAVAFNNQNPTQVQYTPTYNLINPTVPSEVDCLNINFRNGGINSYNVTNQSNYAVFENGSGLNIICDKNDKFYTVFNILGAVIIKGEFENSTLTLSTKNLANGVYFIQILNQQHIQVSAIKFVQK